MKKRWVGSKPVGVRPIKRRNSEGGEGLDMMGESWDLNWRMVEDFVLSFICHLLMRVLSCPPYIFHP